MRLPASTKVVGYGAFRYCKHLRRAELNEGLEALGAKWNGGRGDLRGHAFAYSGIKSIRIPSTLKTIEGETFSGCKKLRSVELSEGLEEIGWYAFTRSSIGSVVFPSSTRVIGESAFERCTRLRNVWLNEGLKSLGGPGPIGSGGTSFKKCAMKSIEIPSTLAAISSSTFMSCKNLKKIEFREGRKVLGKSWKETDAWNTIFRKCGIKEVVLPSTLREMSPDIFKNCADLKTVRVAEGCRADVEDFVSSSVKVKKYKH